MAEQTTTSQIDPAIRPFLTAGLERAQQLFLTGPQPTFFPGQTYVSPSAATTEAIAQQEALARAPSSLLQQAQQAYQSSLGQVGQTAAGGFLQGNPYQQAMLQAAQRPLVQQYSEQVVPGISSLFSRAGRYGSGAMERALGTSTEAFGRALGDVSANIVGRDYANERQLMQQAQAQQAALAQAAPSIYSQQFIPSQQLAQVGAAQEQIAMQPLQEQLARFNFEQQQPRQALSAYLSSVYGNPMGSYGTQTTQMPQNTLMSGVAGAGLGYLGGQALGSVLPSGFGFGAGSPFSLTSPTSIGLAGAGLGGLLGFF